MTQDLVQVKKAYEDDWSEILEILHSTELPQWFIDANNYKNFFYVEDPALGKIICCFQIFQDGEVGILRSFALRPEHQKQGMGKLIADIIIPPLIHSLGIKRLYARGNFIGECKINGFWEKTVFKHIDVKDIPDKLFKDDILMAIEKHAPHEFFAESAFLLDLDKL